MMQNDQLNKAQTEVKGLQNKVKTDEKALQKAEADESASKQKLEKAQADLEQLHTGASHPFTSFSLYALSCLCVPRVVWHYQGMVDIYVLWNQINCCEYSILKQSAHNFMPCPSQMPSNRCWQSLTWLVKYGNQFDSINVSRPLLYFSASHHRFAKRLDSHIVLPELSKYLAEFLVSVQRHHLKATLKCLKDWMIPLEHKYLEFRKKPEPEVQRLLQISKSSRTSE